MFQNIGMLQQVAPYSLLAMTFDGSSYYSISDVTYSGNKITVMARFKIATFPSSLKSAQRVMEMGQITAGQRRVAVWLYANDRPIPDTRSKIAVMIQDSTGGTPCRLLSIDDLDDDEWHTAFFAFDGDAGTAIFYIDGVDADDTGASLRIAPITATLPTSGTNENYVGALKSGSYEVVGDLSYIGYKDAYLTNPTDFHHPTNGVQKIDETGWTEWGGQPEFWNAFGTMTDNKGSAGNMTANGTITGPA